jgi:hypothetical protein
MKQYITSGSVLYNISGDIIKPNSELRIEKVLKPFKCVNCGGSELKKNKCEYCGTLYVMG